MRIYVSLILFSVLCILIIRPSPASGNGTPPIPDDVVEHLRELRDLDTGTARKLSEPARQKLKLAIEKGLVVDYSEKALGTEEQWRFNCYLQLAGLTEEPSFRPVLKSIANHYEDRSPIIVLYALHSLWLSGESRDFFLDCVRDWDPSDTRARMAGLILSFQPEEDAMDVLEEAKKRSNRGRTFDQAVNLIRNTRSLARGLEHHPTVKEKVDELVEILMLALKGSDWAQVVWIDQWIAEDLPFEVWAREQLRRLAQQHPDEVREAISTVVVPERLPEAHRHKYQWFIEYLRRFVPDIHAQLDEERGNNGH